MPDIYRSFSELSARERRGVDYQIEARVRPSPVLILAPHGGGIEPGTSEIARAIAGDAYSYYCFEGIKNAHNETLHIASHCFDEPIAVAMLQPAELVLTLHGCIVPGERVLIGGRDTRLGDLVRGQLNQARITAARDNSEELGGRLPYNLCNRGRSGQGCQLEISRELRETLFEALNRRGRKHPLSRFDDFVQAIRAALGAIAA